MVSQTSVNFDFSLGVKKLDNFIKEYIDAYAKDVERVTKSNIKTGTYFGGRRLAELKDSTRAVRKARKQEQNRPLIATGALLNSVKQRFNSVDILEYGLLHNEGFKTGSNSMIPNKTVPSRPFVETTFKNQKRQNKVFVSKIRRAIKLNKPIVMKY